MMSSPPGAAVGPHSAREYSPASVRARLKNLGADYDAARRVEAEGMMRRYAAITGTTLRATVEAVSGTPLTLIPGGSFVVTWWTF